MRKSTAISVFVVFILLLGLWFTSKNPIVGTKSDLPDGYAEAIKSQSAGFYSSGLPLIPVYISVESVSEQRVYYTVYYFPIGCVGMSFSETDGYNIEKPLFPGA